VDNLKSGVLDTDLSSVAGTDTTLASAKAIKAYVDAQITAQDLDFQGDSGGALSIDLDSETLDIAGGTGIDTSGSSNTLTVAIDSTVTTLAGTQTLTNKTLTTPVISSISNTGTITLPTSSDTLVGRATTDTLTNKTIDANGTGNSITNLEVADLASGVLDTDLSSVSGSDDTLASAKAIKTYIDAQVTAQDLDFQGDSGGALSIDLDSETLDIAGGTGIDTSGSSNTLTVAIDSTVTTLTGTQTLTNKTLTSPTINGGSLSSAVTATTQAAGTSNTTIATTAFAQTAASNEAVALAIALG
jgi:phosphopantetheinyl transferase (holo-ACP synthase)